MKIKLYNKIAEIGLEKFGKNYEYGEDIENEDGIVLRSAKLHDVTFPKTLKAIARAGAGTNNIPVDRCSEEGIVVFNTPGANANGVKELVLLGMLMSCRPVYDALKYTETLEANDEVATKVEKEKSRFKGNEIAGKTLGVIGLGAIGVKVANAAQDLGMQVYGYDPFLSVDAAWQLSKEVKHTRNIDTICKNCDFITVHVPLNDKTRGLIGAEEIALMKPNTVLMNFARGGLVDETAAIKALEADALKMYIVDFPSKEVIGKKGVMAIPHLGASTDESEDNCAVMAVKELKDFLENGNVVNSVNLPNVKMDRSGLTRISVFHRNVPNMLAQISETVSKHNINIENMLNKSKGDYAYTIVDIDAKKIDGVVEDLNKVEAILRVNTYK